ncbi:DpnII family type II restriction endonuclease [Crocosphaera watsonii WH 8501]|uniref:General secretion pathway protein E / Type II secretory pathway, ATPase PulE/Tfp pilus assembly pathway, ATPase PilB n=1 Tax=Crocosphaera watsonii WH 8502 TaxID=423474 RepID=T2ICR5_CROWT|nr:general secretion pathway protein GspE [Crocosphaera watsonii]CCQ50649.1 General secretion pathway protein E / Type II secretory pathway, ATPase PulE/Tfp pilus assembly pathway, ATPase PilB [Crocosphaera watsonii WH 8502]
MKYSSIFSDIIDCGNSEQVFDYLIQTLKESIVKWNYFINWEKVNDNFRDIEISLNLLNYLGFAEKVSPKFMPLLTKNFLTNQ